MTSSPVWMVEQARALGVAIDLTTAAPVLGSGMSRAYRLVAADRFPAQMIRVGTRVMVPVAGLLLLLSPPACTRGTSAATPRRRSWRDRPAAASAQHSGGTGRVH